MPDVIDKVMSFIGKDNESGSDKDILLKQLAKEISQNKYAKFYRARQGEADVSLGQYFYNLYKIVYPMQIFLKDPSRETRIKQITLEAFLDKHTMDLIKRLSNEGIAERKQTAGDNLSGILQEDLAALSAGFDNPKIATADKCYNLITSMKQFVFFDFCSMLRKFDPDMAEGDFMTQPKFTPVDINILAPDLSAFLSVMPSFDAGEDWKTVFEILKYCKGGTDVIPPALWNNLLVSLRDIKHSKVLELIGKLATGNPILEIKTIVHNESLSAAWLEQKTADVRRVIAGIADSQRNAHINNIEQSVFGNLATTRLEYYNSEKGRILSDKELEGYDYAPALNHLLAFIQEFLSKEIQELSEILLVRGQWTQNNNSRVMSEAFHSVLDVTSEITALDESLSEEGSNGPRLRGALLRVDRDKTQARYINAIINGINEEALNIINRAVPSLIVVGKHFKMLLDDCEKKPFELIMNWKELNGVSKLPISQRIAAAYKKINLFVQLMMVETRETKED
jgi:hypothetical protein